MNNKAHPFYFEQSQFYWVPAGFCWRRKWQPTPVFLPGESCRQRSLVGCGPWGSQESDMTERLPFHFSLSCIGEGNGNHSSILAWRIPGTGEPVGCHLWGRTESDTTEAA